VESQTRKAFLFGDICIKGEKKVQIGGIKREKKDKTEAAKA
jgi:hypothetical protein